MLRSRHQRSRGVWFGLGMFGLVGWSVTIPALACLGLGIWIDSQFQSRFSWTLMLLPMGIVVGCLNAWYWVKEKGSTNRSEQME